MMTAAIAQDTLAKNYAASGGTKALPWAAILQAIMALFGGCTPKVAKRFATRHPAAFTEMVENKLEDDGMIDKADISTAAKAAHMTITNAEVEDIAAVWYETKA